MIEATFGTRDGEGNRLLGLFHSPTRILIANQLDEVRPLIVAAEAAAKDGSWVALMMSYEAAPAFDVAMKTRPAPALPLAWAGVFSAPDEPLRDASAASYQVGTWQPRVSREEFGDAISKIRELIAAGDTYQVNYTFPLVADFQGDARAWYQDLCRAQGEGYFAYLDLGRFKVLSLSPELFFERNGETITTRPMKGTIKRGRWPDEDEIMRRTLEDSAKDRAENVMIVDLLRNDLGRIAQAGSVKVERLFDIERYETLWQMTSTISATARASLELVDVLAALFPCGSITGAPKIRTMEIITELEPFAREAYTGTIGFLKPGGDAIFNVAIRTVVIDSETKQATFGVGGGITYDSTAEREYQECLVKSSFLNRPAGTFELLESLLIEDGEYFLLERHLARLKSSANYFGFRFDESAILRTLNEVASKHATISWKVRLLLSRGREIRHETKELQPSSEPLRVALSNEPVSSTDRFLFHKTTNRAVYERALAQRSDCDEVVLWNERGEITEATVSNVVVSIDGELVTPPQAAGLLAGTFRDELLAAGVIKERVIRKDELRPGMEILLINSVYKWRKAVIVD